MNVCITRISPTEDDRLKVQGFPLWVGNGHVHKPLDLLAIIQLTVGSQHLHHHVQGSGPWKGHMLQQRQVFLLRKLVTDGFSFSEIFIAHNILLIGLVCLPEKSSLGKED